MSVEKKMKRLLNEKLDADEKEMVDDLAKLIKSKKAMLKGWMSDAIAYHFLATVLGREPMTSLPLRAVKNPYWLKGDEYAIEEVHGLSDDAIYELMRQVFPDKMPKKAIFQKVYDQWEENDDW